MPHRMSTFTLQEIKAQKARMEANLHSIGGTMHQTRPEGRKDKMHTSQTGGHLTDSRQQKAQETKEEAGFSALPDAMFGGQNAPRGRCKGNFCTAEDRELETVGTRAGSMLQKVKRSKHYEWGQLLGNWTANKDHICLANFPSEHHMCWAEGPLCRQGEAQKIAEGGWQQMKATCTLQTMERAFMAEPSWGLFLVKHRCQESSSGQQVIKKMLWNLPMGGIVVHCHPPSGTSRNFCK